MINQSNVLMNSIQNSDRETMAGNLQMGYKGPCYSQPESSAVAAARVGNAAMAGFGTLPPPLSTVMLSTESYPMPPHMFQKQTYQPMASPVQTAPVFTPTSPMMVPSAHGGYFNIPAGFIPNPSLGMPPEYMVPTSTEASVQT
jgi:hypothetical protein